MGAAEGRTGRGANCLADCVSTGFQVLDSQKLRQARYTLIQH
jgi:hypothetical protein